MKGQNLLGRRQPGAEALSSNIALSTSFKKLHFFSPQNFLRIENLTGGFYISKAHSTEAPQQH